MSGPSFYIPFDWLQANWQDIHGAFHVNVKRIGGSTKDARRLSRYMVSQYCGGQVGLVRVSQSKPEIPLGRMREELRRMLKSMPERYEQSQSLLTLPPEEFDVAFRRLVRNEFQEAWESLVRVGACELFGVKLVWLWEHLERL